MRDKEGIHKKENDERKKTLHEGKLQGQIVEKTRNISHVFRKVDKEWVYEERDRRHVICSSGAGTKDQFNQSKDRQTNSLYQM